MILGFDAQRKLLYWNHATLHTKNQNNAEQKIWQSRKIRKISENFDINNFKDSLRTQRLNLEANIKTLIIYTTAFWPKIITYIVRRKKLLEDWAVSTSNFFVKSKSVTDILLTIMSDSIITLDVGGQIFKTHVSTLTKYPDSMLAVMFNHTDQGSNSNYIKVHFWPQGISLMPQLSTKMFKLLWYIS